MALVFVRKLTVTLWVLAFAAVAVTAPPPATLSLVPPTTLFVMAFVGIALYAFTEAGSAPWLPAYRDRALVSLRRPCRLRRCSQA